MLNDIFLFGINLIDMFYNAFLTVPINTLNTAFTKINEYSGTLTDLIQAIYFICGKGLVVFGVGVGFSIITIKVIFAIINLVGQFVP